MDKYPATNIPTNPLNKRVYELACRIAAVFDAVPEGVYLLLKHVIEQKDFEDTYYVTDCPKAVRQNFKEEFLNAIKQRFGTFTIQKIITYRTLAVGKYSLCCGSGTIPRGNRDLLTHTFSYIYYNDQPDSQFVFPAITLLRESVPEVEGLDEWLKHLEADADELSDEEE